MLFGCACGMGDVGIRRVGFYEGHLEGKGICCQCCVVKFSDQGF